MGTQSDINASGSGDTGALSAAGNPYGVGSYDDVLTSPFSGVPNSVDSTPINTSTLNSQPDPSITPAATGALIPADPSTATTASTGGTSSTSDWSSILSGLGSILGSPLASAASMVGLGEYEASQAQSQTKGLTSQLTGPSQPLVQGGVTEAGAAMQGLTGAPVTTGSLGQQETAAANLGKIATDYSTGQLTPAQQQQVQQQVQAQQQNIRSQLAQQGITDASVIAMYDQQIQDNAAQLTQQLITQNTQLASSALGTVQQTYSNILNQAISQFGAGMGPIEDAVNLTVQQNTAIANGLQSLFGQIARGFSGASGTAAGGATAGIASGLSGIMSGISNLLGLGSGTGLANINDPAAIGQETLNETPAIPVSTIPGVNDPNNNSFTTDANLGIDTSASTDATAPTIDLGPGVTLDDELAALGFSGAGGQAANGGFQPLTADQLPPIDTSSLTDMSLSDIPNLASQQAASSASPLGSIGAGLSTAGTLAGIVGGLESHTPVGEAGAALSAASLANKTGVLGTPSSTVNTELGAAGGALGLYQGLERGGVAGDLTAASGAARLGSGVANLAGDSSLATGLGDVAGAIAIPLAAYNEITNWRSGATGSDALGGAETGATVGSVFGPIGAGIGAVIGGAVGALSSLFGGGKTDPESLSLSKVTSSYSSAYAQNPQGAQQALSEMSPAQSFQMLAGAFDAKNNTPGHSQPIAQVWGRMQEGAFVNDMAAQINSAVESGAISPSTPPAQVYAQVVQPWINSKTNGQGILGGANGEGGVLTGAIQNLIGAYMGGQLTSNTAIGVSGQMDTGLPQFA